MRSLIRPLALPVLLLPVLTLLGSCSHSKSGGSAVVTLTSIEVSPVTPSLAAGTSLQLVATGVYSDSSKEDLTEQVTWSSDDMVVATVDDTPGTRGWMEALTVGTAQVAAELDSVIGETTVTVTAATLTSIEVTPVDPSIALGTSQAFEAVGLFSDGTKQTLTDSVTWDSDTPAVAAPSVTPGLEGVALSASTGTATISATLDMVSGSSDLTVTPAVLVSVEVAPTNPSIALGTERQFTATGIFSDATNQDLTLDATWSSDAPGVATIQSAPGAAGHATSVGTGSATITADVGGTMGTTTLTVTAATLVSIDVTPTAPSIPLGLDQVVTATGIFTDGTSQDLTELATWSSSDDTTVLVSNGVGSSGFATTLATGSVTVSATFDGVTGSTGIVVTPPILVRIGITPVNPSLALGTWTKLSAIGIYTDDTTEDLTDVAVWSSSDPGVATVGNTLGSEGEARSVSIGTSTITAAHDGINGTTLLTVGPATLVSIDVTPSFSSLPLGLTRSCVATGTYTDATKQDITDAVTWSSSDPAVATVSNAAGSEGLVTSVTTGAITVTATLGGTSGSTGLTITPAVLTSIQIAVDSTSLPLGLSESFEATGFFSDGSSQDLTSSALWTSSNGGVAAISNAAGSEGLLTATGLGTTTVTATRAGISGSIDLTVTAAILTSIDVTPAMPSTPLGFGQQYTATGTYSDATTQDVTQTVTWDSSDTGVAEISNAPGSRGFLSSLSVGTTTVSATLGAVMGSADQTVTSATLVSIDVAPAASTVVLGTQTQFVATGNFSDASVLDLTGYVTWGSTDTGVSAISNAVGSEGLAQTVAAGTTTISATFGAVSGSTSLDVVLEILVSIEVTPADLTVAKNTQLQYTATGTFSDMSTQDITASVSWSSSDVPVVTITSKGKAKSHKVGVTDITATLGAVSGTTTLTVTP